MDNPIMMDGFDHLAPSLRAYFLARAHEEMAIFRRLVVTPRNLSLTFIGTLAFIGCLVAWIELFVPRLAINLPILFPKPDYIASLLWALALPLQNL